MVNTSNTYNPYADVRHCDIKAVFELIDVNAHLIASATASDFCELSRLRQTHDRIESMSVKYASMEHDYWRLDGTFILPNKNDTVNQNGWWSEHISNQDGVFTDPPQLTFTWQSNRKSVGFTVCFDDKAEEFPTLFKVYAYDYTGALISETTVQNHSVRCFVDLPVEGYRTLVFKFLETSKPVRRVRVAEVLFGAVWQFDRVNIVSASLETAFSPTSENLPISEFNLTINNSDKEWNMANPEGIYAYLGQQQPLKLWFGINSEWVFMGQYYFTSATAEEDALTAKITSHDKIYQLDRVKYRGSASESWAFSQAIEAVLNYSGISITFSIPAYIGSRLISGTLPEDISCRDAVKMLSQAARCSCNINRDGVLTFFDPLTVQETLDTLDFDKMSAMPKISVGEKVNIVELIVRTEIDETVYTASDLGVDEPICTTVYENPLVLNDYGEITAQWLLAVNKRRFSYKIQERGNPARDILDWITVYDPYGGIRNAMVTRQKFDFDGGLKCETEAQGVDANG